MTSNPRRRTNGTTQLGPRGIIGIAPFLGVPGRQSAPPPAAVRRSDRETLQPGWDRAHEQAIGHPVRRPDGAVKNSGTAPFLGVPERQSAPPPAVARRPDQESLQRGWDRAYEQALGHPTRRPGGAVKPSEIAAGRLGPKPARG